MHRQGAPRPDPGWRALLERSGTQRIPAQGIPRVQGTRGGAVPRDRAEVMKYSHREMVRKVAEVLERVSGGN